MWLLNDVPEKQPKYTYRSLLVIFPLATLSIGFFVWAVVKLPLWIALPAGIVVIAFAFILTFRIVNRIIPDHLPKDEGS